jgi:hypothetical protein
MLKQCLSNFHDLNKSFDEKASLELYKTKFTLKYRPSFGDNLFQFYFFPVESIFHPFLNVAVILFFQKQKIEI